jgi:hypothetical protein
MTTEDILQLRDRGEMSKVQFKNDERTHEFLITITRRNDLDTDSDTFRADSDISPDTTPNIKGEYPNTTPVIERSKLTNKQKDIINFCSIPRSSREILERAGVKYHNTNIKKYVTGLVDAGYLIRTIPDNPFDMNQKYRKK